MRWFSPAIYGVHDTIKEKRLQLARPPETDNDAASDRRVKVAVVSPSASLRKARHAPTCHVCEPVWPSGKAGKRKDLGSIPLRLSFLFKKVVVCGHCLVTLFIISY